MPRVNESVEYLGRVVGAKGIHISRRKLQAEMHRNQRTSTNCLGMINYYSQFIPDLSTLLKTLYSLLKANQWSGECHGALEEVKRQLTSSLVLAHYDTEVPLVLAVDASAYGLGVVLSHHWPDGTERPVAFASRTLNDSEKNYPQVEKEALALAVGVKKFNKYMCMAEFSPSLWTINH